MSAENAYKVSDPEEPQNHVGDSKRNHNFQKAMCGFYGMVLFVLGLVFPISTALAASSASDQDYLMILHLIMNSSGIIFLLYLLLFLICNNTRGGKDSEKGTDNTSATTHWDPEGVNIYVRLGAIFFGLATLVQGVFRLVSECRGTIFVVTYSTNVAFVVLQTITLVKYHKACIAARSFLVRWGFAHLIAVNLSQWAFVVVAEIKEQMMHKFAHAGDHETDHGGDHADDGYGDFLNTSMSGHDEAHEIHKRAAAAVPPGGCDFSSSLQYKSAPYLFPCIIEYSLVMAAISFTFFSNVARQPVEEHHEEEKGTEPKCSFSYFFSGTTGTLSIIAAVTAVVLIFVKKEEDFTVDFFYYLQFTLLVIAFVIVIAVIARFAKLGWRDSVDMLDGRLLLVAFFLSLVLDVFTVIGSIGQYSFSSTIALTTVFRAMFSILQSVLQTVFILDGLARCARTREQSEYRPGRSIVLCLLLVNIGLWIMAVFEIKLYKSVNLLEEFYGIQGWTITKAICQPLVIFFRFHSTVCLADIFTEAYHYHPHSE